MAETLKSVTSYFPLKGGIIPGAVILIAAVSHTESSFRLSRTLHLQNPTNQPKNPSCLNFSKKSTVKPVYVLKH